MHDTFLMLYRYYYKLEMCSVSNVYELCSELVMHMSIQYETDKLRSMNVHGRSYEPYIYNVLQYIYQFHYIFNIFFITRTSQELLSR